MPVSNGSSPMRSFMAWQRRAIRQQLIEKYGPYCQLCLLEGLTKVEALIELDTANQPRSWSVDHITPMSRGGLNVIENMHPAHRNCNSYRGNNDLVKVENAKL